MSIWSGATVLLTGGTGWFGHAFVEHALTRLDVRSLRVYSRDEHKQHTMRQRWSDTLPGSRVTYIVGDVRDADRLRRAMHDVTICVTAAALKRVEGSSTHARELLKTNTLGTANVIDAAIDAGVRRTVFLSSDKGLMATNAYGKSKALAEDLVIEGNAIAGGRDTRFATCRYGNIIGSTGSVLHLWQAAVDAGQPIPVTHPEMTRFLMPVGRAVHQVQMAVDVMRGGEIFCPEMPRARLVDLAEAAYPGWPTRIVGERPGGEKFHEMLIGEDEGRHATWLQRWPGSPLDYDPVYVIHPQQPTWDVDYAPYGDPPGTLPVRSDGPANCVLGVGEIRDLLSEAGLAPQEARAA